MKDCRKLFGSSPEPSPSRNKSSAVMKSGSSRPGRKSSANSNLSPLGFYKKQRSPRYSRFCLTFFSRFFTPFFFFLRFLASTCTVLITNRNRTKMIPDFGWQKHQLAHVNTSQLKWTQDLQLICKSTFKMLTNRLT